MLVLSRKAGEKIVINGNITISVVSVIGNRVKLGIEAPDDVPILRGELVVDPEVAGFRDQWHEETTATEEQPTATVMAQRPMLHARVCESFRRMRQLPR
jgi:carbon storage regulator